MMQRITLGLIGSPVFDRGRRRVGHLARLYLDLDVGDRADDEVDARFDVAHFAGVAVRQRGRTQIMFVALGGAGVDDTGILLAWSGAVIRRAPRVSAGHPMPVALERVLFLHYGLPYEPALDGVRRLVPVA
ncbi:MAG: hypothetical protein ACTHMS_13335 [Jatrophihabitans sp.]|uniref:hypothetical protein n=1 Tax=Jatrophihabitans sp. TaxID=1932789 RepID=UPI003F7D5D4C